MMAPMSAPTERSVRVSTLELFFDLVFVFTVTQLTGVLVDGGDRSSVVQVVVMLAVIWWIYDGYAWLTNAIATDRVRFRLLLIGGMGGFLVIALAVPHAYDGNGLAFGLGYLAVVLLHSSMYVKGTSLAEAAAILRIVPFNLAAAAVVLVGGALGGDVQWLLWAAAAALLWATGWFTSLEGFLIIPEHFVERHGLVVIIALGESIVVIGAGAAGLPSTRGSCSSPSSRSRSAPRSGGSTSPTRPMSSTRCEPFGRSSGHASRWSATGTGTSASSWASSGSRPG